MEWAEAFAGAIPGPQKLAIVAKRVAKVTVTVKDALRREQELKRALEVDKTVNGSLVEKAAAIRNAAAHPQARSRRTIAVGEDAEGRLHAGSSNGFDRGQRAAAESMGIRCVGCKAGAHAEENLLREVPELRRIGTSARSPCGPSEHNCEAQLLERGVEIER
jgi:hypothetical protein